MHQQATKDSDCRRAIMINKAKSFCSNQQYKQAEELADQLFKLKHLQEAIDIYQLIIQSNIDYDYELAGLGNSEEQTGYYQWNIAEWYVSKKESKAIKGSPYDALSLCYSVRKSNIKGEGWYREMVAKYPDNYKLLYGLANGLYSIKCFEECIKLYERVIQIKPDFVHPYVNLAFVFEFQRVEKPKAIKWASKALEIDDKNIFALYIKARNISDVDQKIERFKQLNAMHPEYSRIANDIGIAYGGTKKRYDDAINWYKKCVEINPLYNSAYNNIGVNYELKKQYEEAKCWYYRAIKCDPDYKTAHKNLTDVYDVLKTSEEDILIESKKYELNEEQFCYEFGLSYYDKEKIELSISWYLKAIAINPNSHKFFNSLAIAYDEKKEYDLAIEYYKKCIDIDPTYFSAYYNLAITYKNKGNVEQTITWYLKCIELNPKHSYSYNNLGNIYKNKEEYDTAISYYLKAIEYLSTYTLAFTNLGICYQKSKKYREAIVCFKRANDLFPNDNNSLSKSNKEFLQKQLKQYKEETDKWKKTGKMSINIQGIKNAMVEEFERKVKSLYFPVQVNPEIAVEEEKSTEGSQSCRQALETKLQNELVS